MSGDGALEEGMTYVEKLDFREQAHRHSLEVQQEETKRVVARAKGEKAEARWQALAYVAIAIVAGAVILGIAYAIYRGTTGPDDSARIEQEREQACVEAGGGWVPEDMLNDSAERGLCVFPGE